MVVLILVDSRLHIRMCFFLSDLPLVDFCYSTAVTPKAMAELLMGDQVISYNACAAQMFFFVALAMSTPEIGISTSAILRVFPDCVLRTMPKRGTSLS